MCSCGGHIVHSIQVQPPPRSRNWALLSPWKPLCLLLVLSTFHPHPSRVSAVWTSDTMCIHYLVCLCVNLVQRESIHHHCVHFMQAIVSGCCPLIYPVVCSSLCEHTTCYLSLQLLLGGWQLPVWSYDEQCWTNILVPIFGWIEGCFSAGERIARS